MALEGLHERAKATDKLDKPVIFCYSTFLGTIRLGKPPRANPRRKHKMNKRESSKRRYNRRNVRRDLRESQSISEEMPNVHQKGEECC